MTGQPYAVLFSAPAAKVLDTLPEHAEDTVWDVLDAAATDSWGSRHWNADVLSSAPVHGPGRDGVRCPRAAPLSSVRVDRTHVPGSPGSGTGPPGGRP
ncbi:hypothetical protein ACFVH0_16835 [Streptomyces sp. NPDC127117]|uniref:hypothetical protein n=1 Tax=Streptomyces sp. NPDC127117 TaxID=3345368 RepID=UPI003635DCF3